MSYQRRGGLSRRARGGRALAVLALAAVIAGLVAAVSPAVAVPSAAGGTANQPARDLATRPALGVDLPPPAVLVLVGRLTWDEAAAAARRRGGPVTAGLLATLPRQAPLADRVLTLAAAHRVRGADADPARLDRFRAATPDGCYRRLPPVEVAAPGLDAAGLLAVRDRGTPPPARPLPASGPLAPTPGRLLVVAVPDATGLDGVLGRLPAGTRALVAGLAPAPGRARTTPLLDLGGPVGQATSASTRRVGLVALVDLCPTLVGDGGVADGAPIRAVAAADPLAEITRLDRRVAALVTARTWAIPLLVLAAVLAAGAVARWRLRGRPEAARAARALLLLTLALPSGYLLASRVAPPSAPAWLAIGVAAGGVLAAGAAAGATRLAGEPRWSAPVVLGVVLLVLVAADLATGGHGLERPLLGGSAYDGERFYGLGNGYFAMALAAIMLVAAFTRLPAGAVAAMLGGLALIDGLPMLGADVGGALTASLTAALALLLLGRRRSLAGTLLLLGLAAVAGLAVVAAAALLADPATHGSRFLGTLVDEGPAAAGRVVARQLGRNFALLAGSPFAWVGPLEVLAAALAALWPPAELAAVPDRARRVVLLGALGSALLVLLNDTGVTATAASGLFLLAILVWSALDAAPAEPPHGGAAEPPPTDPVAPARPGRARPGT
jgi:hypothetical protein